MENKSWSTIPPVKCITAFLENLTHAQFLERQKQHSIFCSLETCIVFDLRRSASTTAEGLFVTILVSFRSQVKGTTLKDTAADTCMPTEVLTSLQR